MRNLVVFCSLIVVLVVGACDGTGGDSRAPSSEAPATSTAPSSPPTTEALTTSSSTPASSTTTFGVVVEPPQMDAASTVDLGVFDVVEESPGLLLIDSDENPVWNAPGLFQFPDGRLRVIYAFGGVRMPEGCEGYDCVVEDETRIRMATCVTPECSQVEIVEIPQTRFVMFADGHSGDSETGWVAFDSEGVPFLVWTAVDLNVPYGEQNPVSVLMICVDPACSEIAFTDTYEYDRWNEEGFNVESWSVLFVTTPDGTVASLGNYGWVPDPDVWEGWTRITYSVCDETLTCLKPEAGSVLIEGVYPFGTVDAARVGFTPEGNPVISYRELNQTGQRLLTCTDPECTGTLPKTRVLSFNISDWPGGIHIADDGTTYLAIEEWTEPNDTSEITVTWCSDHTCDESVTTDLHSLDPAGSYAPLNSTLGADNLPRLVWTTREGFEYTRCINTECTDYETTKTGIPAKHMSILTSNDGNPIIGIVDSNSVKIYRCTNQTCTP